MALVFALDNQSVHVPVIARKSRREALAFQLSGGVQAVEPPSVELVPRMAAWRTETEA